MSTTTDEDQDADVDQADIGNGGGGEGDNTGSGDGEGATVDDPRRDAYDARADIEELRAGQAATQSTLGELLEHVRKPAAAAAVPAPEPLPPADTETAERSPDDDKEPRHTMSKRWFG